MMRGAKGYALIEVMVAVTIMAAASVAAGAAIYQVFSNINRASDQLTTVRQVQNAGHWIRSDAMMALTVTSDDLDPLDFLILNWTLWDDAGENPVYHTVTYFFEELSADDIGTLMRNHWSSAGANEETMIAQYIQYDVDDADNTSGVSYASPVLTVQLTASYEQTRETREYKIRHRPDL